MGTVGYGNPRYSDSYHAWCEAVFTARRNACIASAILALAFPSVRLSVTRRYCAKTTARSTVQFALSDSKMCLVF